MGPRVGMARLIPVFPAPASFPAYRGRQHQPSRTCLRQNRQVLDAEFWLLVEQIQSTTATPPRFPTRASSRLETCERLLSPIPHGGRPYTVQGRRVDAGERTEPLGPARRGDFAGPGPAQAGPHAGSLNGGKGMKCRSQCGGCGSTPAGDTGSANSSVYQQLRPQAETQRDRITGGSHRPEAERVSGP